MLNDIIFSDYPTQNLSWWDDWGSKLFIPIFAGLVGFIVAKAVERYKERQRIKKLWQFTYTWLDYSFNLIKNQIGFSSAYLQSLKEDDYEKHIVEAEEIDLKRFLEIDNSDLYTMFLDVKERSDVDIEKFTSFINIIQESDATYNNILKVGNSLSEESFKSFEKLNQQQTSIKQLQLNISTLRRSGSLNHTEEEQYTKLLRFVEVTPQPDNLWQSHLNYYKKAYDILDEKIHDCPNLTPLTLGFLEYTNIIVIFKNKISGAILSLDSSIKSLDKNLKTQREILNYFNDKPFKKLYIIF